MDGRRGSTGSYSSSFDPRTVALLNRIASKRKALLGRTDLMSATAIKSRDGQSSGDVMPLPTGQGPMIIGTVTGSQKVAGPMRPVSTARTTKLSSMLGDSVGNGGNTNRANTRGEFKDTRGNQGIPPKRIGSAPPPNQRGAGPEPTPPVRNQTPATLQIPGGRPGSATLKSWSHRGERGGGGAMMQGSAGSGQVMSPLKSDRTATISIHGRNPASGQTMAGDAGAALRATTANDDGRGRSQAKKGTGKDDAVVFTESAYAPGVPVVYRTNHERATNPERLNLDRRKLTVCPILEGEERLRLLNYQNNSIAEINNIKRLPNLIFLDLYNNNITEIKNLENVPTLRVLMLGKNQIETIKGLDSLVKLDVLDLHSNSIRSIENIGHLGELRVLNLAGNQIITADNFEGLNALTELNLRRNKVTILRGLDGLPSLQRVFLSNNHLASFEACSCLFHIKYLMELALDGNPVGNLPYYRQHILENVRTLRHLDLKRITEEERRITSVMVKKEEEKTTEKMKREQINEERNDALSVLQQEWAEGGDVLRKGWFEVERKGEMEHVHVYGNTMDCLDKCPLVDSISFNYVSFDRITAFLSKLRKMTNLKSLRFSHNNLDSFSKLSKLHSVSNVTNLTITNNSILECNLFRQFATYRLSHVTCINGVAVPGHERVAAQMLFGSLNRTMAGVKHAWMDPSGLPRPSSDINAEGENEAFTAYQSTRQSVNRANQRSGDVANRYISQLTAQSTGVMEKIEWLDSKWADAVAAIVKATVHDLEDISGFMTHCLDDM